MTEIALAEINNFAPLPAQGGNEQPVEEPVLIITLGQLQDLIKTAVNEAVAPLKDEIQDLKEELATLQEDLRKFRVFTNTGKVDDLMEWADGVDRQLQEAKKEREPPAPTQKTLDHLTEIAVILGAAEKRLIENQAPTVYLTRLRREGLTFCQLAARMGLTVDRIRQLSRIAATDQRFNITWHPRRKNTKIIKLRKWDAQNS